VIDVLTDVEPLGDRDDEPVLVTLAPAQLGWIVRALVAARRTERPERSTAPPLPPRSVRPWEA
jgi:hypothetical protein